MEEGSFRYSTNIIKGTVKPMHLNLQREAFSRMIESAPR